MNKLKLLTVALAIASLPFAVVHAADKSCLPIEKAGELGKKQARIHQALDIMRPVNPGPKDKVVPLGEDLMHTIAVDKTQFMSLVTMRFGATEYKTLEERNNMMGVALFGDWELGCRSLGKVVIAGRTADVYETGSNKTVDDRYMKFWIDTQTGLPLRGVTDEAGIELSSFSATKDGRPKIETKRTNNRMLSTIAFVYGDAVKAPKLSGAKDIMGSQKGEIDAAAAAMLKALIKG
jgi:hypothetical protein